MKIDNVPDHLSVVGPRIASRLVLDEGAFPDGIAEGRVPVAVLNNSVPMKSGHGVEVVRAQDSAGGTWWAHSPVYFGSDKQA